ncbi:MAG TPA: orotidine-5'-phosphate decarboxylase [Gemmatimonadales bacterium]|jgi:orotidine-5'-phosphate decarboxylase
MAELIVALDHADPADAIALLDLLPERAPVKVGAVLLARAGIGFVRGLVTDGHPVFLDPKWHDIPNTVSGAVSAAAALGVDMITVHALGGEAMLRAAVAAAAGRTRIIAVTVLTSHSAAEFAAITGRNHVDPGEEVVRLAGIAAAAGVTGVVCSPHEIPLVRGLTGLDRIVVPGIRREGDAAGDQQRVATPATAIAAGATHLVVGRPITGAADPAAAYQAFAGAIRGT